jgi:hypothetical protein
MRSEQTFLSRQGQNVGRKANGVYPLPVPLGTEYEKNKRNEIINSINKRSRSQPSLWEGPVEVKLKNY